VFPYLGLLGFCINVECLVFTKDHSFQLRTGKDSVCESCILFGIWDHRQIPQIILRLNYYTGINCDEWTVVPYWGWPYFTLWSIWTVSILFLVPSCGCQNHTYWCIKENVKASLKVSCKVTWYCDIVLNTFYLNFSTSLIFNTKIYSVLKIEFVFTLSWGILYFVGPFSSPPHFMYLFFLVAKCYLELPLT